MITPNADAPECDFTAAILARVLKRLDLAAYGLAQTVVKSLLSDGNGGFQALSPGTYEAEAIQEAIDFWQDCIADREAALARLRDLPTGDPSQLSDAQLNAELRAMGVNPGEAVAEVQARLAELTSTPAEMARVSELIEVVSVPQASAPVVIVQVPAWFIHCETGCQCCRHLDHLCGPFSARGIAEAHADRFAAEGKLKSQLDHKGRYRVEEWPAADVLPDGRILAGRSVYPGWNDAPASAGRAVPAP